MTNIKMSRHCSDPLTQVIPALVELVDPEHVHVGETVPLADGGVGVKGGSYGLTSQLPKGFSTVTRQSFIHVFRGQDRMQLSLIGFSGTFLCCVTFHSA